MQTRISMDLGDERLVRLIRYEADATDSSMKDVVVRALEAYLAHRLETRALARAAERAFEEWNDPRDADYDKL
jgi:hypothetical protein